MGCANTKEEAEIAQGGLRAVSGNNDSVTNDLLDAAIDSANSLKTRVSLTFEGIKLPNLDQGSKTDAFTVLYQIVKGRRIKLGETEVVPDSLNPKWVKNIIVDYYFEMQQLFSVEVYDADDINKLKDLSRHDFIGRYNFTLGKVVSSKDQELIGNLNDGSNTKNAVAQIKISSTELKDDFDKQQCNMGEIQCTISNDSYVFLVFNKDKDGFRKRYFPVYKTESKLSKQNTFQYNGAVIGVDTMFGSSQEGECLIQAFQYAQNGNHKKLGQCHLTLSEVREATNGEIRINIGKGELVLKKTEIQERVTFLDYIFGGCEIGVHVAVDYTLSNGAPDNPNSLHYYGRNMRNQYTDAIAAVCEILKDYDADQMFPVYGFGGKVPNHPEEKVSHLFALNGDIFNPEVNGVEGIMEVYYNSLKKVKLHGPTNFAPSLEMINGFCDFQQQEMSQNNQKYTICLMITDGVITDFEKTIDQIVKASNKPLSIIIIGVGDADFELMEALDGDIAPLYSKNLRMYRGRDIVQFVPFRDLKGDPSRLAKEVLAEVPAQMVSYFNNMRIRPNPKLYADRRALQIRNRLNNQVALMMGKPNDYYLIRKQQLIDSCAKYNVDPQKVKAFLDVIGICEENLAWPMQYINQPNYFNYMKVDK